MKAFTLWTEGKYIRINYLYCACIFPFPLKNDKYPWGPEYFAAQDNFCNGLYLATTKKTYTIQ